MKCDIFRETWLNEGDDVGDRRMGIVERQRDRYFKDRPAGLKGLKRRRG